MRNTALALRDFWDFVPSIFDEDRFFTGFDREITRIVNGKCDFEEDDNQYTLEMELPGVAKEEIKLDLKDEVLTVSWSRKKEKKEDKKNGKYEIKEGSFNRSFHVKGVNGDTVSADLNNGVLKIVLPKKESEKARTIAIK